MYKGKALKQLVASVEAEEELYGSRTCGARGFARTATGGRAREDGDVRGTDAACGRRDF